MTLNRYEKFRKILNNLRSKIFFVVSDEHCFYIYLIFTINSRNICILYCILHTYILQN